MSDSESVCVCVCLVSICEIDIVAHVFVFDHQKKGVKRYIYIWLSRRCDDRIRISKTNPSQSEELEEMYIV